MSNTTTIFRKLFDEVHISLEALCLSSKKTTIFDKIVGHNDIKQIFRMALASQKPNHILLVGPPGTSKTMFLEEILNRYSNRAYFTLGAHSSKAGMVNALFERRPRYLLVDEIEHMPLSDQTVLLSLMQSGIISETKIKKTRISTQLKTWVFATSNGTKKLSDALLSRFMVIELEKYGYEEFKDISVQLLVNDEEVEFDLANTIAEEVYKNFKNPNIRDVIKIGRIARNKNDVLMIVRILMKNNAKDEKLIEREKVREKSK
jgi:Holliday junction DNA helicase RuvB